MIKWTKIDKKNLPEETVLAANFKPFTYGYTEKVIGYIHIENDVIICENGHEVLEGCTHYVKVNEFDVKE
tara:strand:+ start:3935 stop:4144 length:210 start_codon:yes stop_codon:yes gene_type:complete